MRNDLSLYETEVSELYKTGRRKRKYPRLCFKKTLDYIYDKFEVEGIRVRRSNKEWRNNCINLRRRIIQAKVNPRLFY